MRPPGWLLVALAAAAADKNKALVATDQEKPLYLFGHIPKCGGVSFVADLVQKLRLTSCFGRKAVVAKGENWTHAMERGRCNFVNTEQWQGMERHFPRPPRVAITDKTGVDGVALWVNDFLGLKGDERLSKIKVHKIARWVMDQYEVHARMSAITDEELEEQVKEHLPDQYAAYLEGVSRKAS